MEQLQEAIEFLKKNWKKDTPYYVEVENPKEIFDFFKEGNEEIT